MATHEGYSLGVNTDFGQVKEANKAVGALYKELEKVNQKSKELHIPSSLPKEINHVNTVTASYIERLQSEGKTYEANQQKVKAYQGAINQLQARQKELEQAFSRTASSADKNSEKYRAQQVLINKNATEINHFKDSLKSAQSEMDRLHPTGFDKWTSAAKRVDTATDRVKSKLHSAWDSIRGGATVATAGIAAVGAAAMSGAKQAGVIQQRYREINNLAVLGGEHQKEVTKSITEMQRQGRDMSIKYGKSQEEIAEGYEDLVKRGYTTKQAVGALQTELQASVASGDKFSDVTTVSSQVLDAFGMRANNTGKMLKNTKEVVNELAYSADATSTSFSDLGIAMSYVGSAAKANNISLAETTAALGVLSNNGFESDKAGTVLRATINGLTNQISKIGSKNSIFTKLGITKSDMLDAHGNLKGLSTDLGILYKHIEEHSNGGAERSNIFKSIFGTTGMNGAMALAKSSKEVEGLTKRTEEAGKTGTYVAKLAAQNMGTAQGSANSAKQAMNAFKMTLGNAVLPAINKASNELAKFLLSKDGKKFQKDVGGAVGAVANTLVKFVEWGSTHKGELKAIGGAVLAGYSISKGRKFIAFLGDVKKGLQAIKAVGFVKNLFGGAEKDGGGISAPSGLLSRFKRKHGAERVIDSEVAKQGPIRTRLRNAVATVKDIPYMLPGGSKVKSGLQRAVGVIRHPISAARTAGSAITATRAGGKVASVGSKILHPLNALKGTRLGSTTLGGAAISGVGKALTVGAGVGIAASSGLDLYKAIKAKNKKQRFTKLGESIGGAVGGGLGLYFGGPLGAMIGSSIGKFVGHITGKISVGFSKSKFGKAINHDFKQSMWTIKGTARSSLKSVSKDVKGIAKAFGINFKRMNKSTKPIQNFFKSGFTAVVRTGIKLVTSTLTRGMKVFTGLFHSAASAVKLIGHTFKGVTSVVGDLIHGKWAKAWTDFKKFGKNAIDDFKGIIDGLWKGVKNVFGWIGDTVGSVWNFVTGKAGKVDNAENSTDPRKASQRINNLRTGNKHPVRSKSATSSIAANNAKIHSLRAHAIGGYIASGHTALVGEAGPELAYKNGRNARLLGANGPAITKVHSGEHILNARDTAKVMSGGLGKGYTLKGYASGTDKLGKTSKKVTNDYKQITSKSSKSLNSLSRKSKQVWRNITSQTTKQSDKTRKKTISDYAEMHKGVTKQTDKTRKEAISDYTDMRKGVVKQNEKLHDGVIDLAGTTSKGFGKELGRMKGYAHDAMGDTIDQVNKGISGIDKVLGQFGGNTSVIKPVKFAKGTDENGRLTRNTLAMVNDATTGPRQEALVSDTGELYFPRGNNVTMMIPKGWGVLNGTQTQQVAQNSGVQHFAKGSGVSHSLLKKIADKGQQNPAQSFANMFTKNVQSSGTDLRKGSTDLANNSSTKLGVPWANAMWTVINDAIGASDGKGGTRESFLKYAEETFSGVPYAMGAASRKLSDCSGMVMQALKHFGISIGRTTVAMQNSSGVQYLGKNLSKTLPGDLVIFGHGTGSAGHVGIIKNPRTGSMFNETPPHARVTNIADDKGMGYGFYRVRGLHNASKSTKSAKADKKLIALAKQELGHSAIKWIKDNLGDDFGSLGSFSIGGDLRDRARALAAGLKKLDPRATKNGIAAVLGNWNFESGGLNPGAINPGGGASGLGQWLGGRLANLKSYAKKHGTSWKNAGTQLSFAVKGEGSDSSILRSILEGDGSVASLANKFSAEWERGGYNAQHVQGAMQIRKALGYAKGGKPAVHTPFIAGEQGPELITADGPVKVDTHDQTKRKLRDITDIIGRPTPRRTRGGGGKAPIININFNGPIYGGKDAAKQIADIVKREIIKILVNIGDEFGTDPSLY
ncbi:phage tail tape measure protein [Lactobacillus acidophilus]|uniref:phage tail tape measure protein n=1 Tax=Lactobacillus acidophilus TaxID=1579 RepID=UPI0021A917A5|nr:phage tail tape measure protein [Lactobacillus acidophilus]MCT3603150.1 phage tail tape measure protein [Lactobacillus acidophilus]MCT3624017.1 phage tail tape measure protein [Lactobacillus acidophilus]